MEVTYSIGVSNRFFLDIDGVSDPQDIFAEKEQKKEKKEKTVKPKQQPKKSEPVKKAPEPEQKSRKDGMGRHFGGIFKECNVVALY